MNLEPLRELEKVIELVAKATPGPWEALTPCDPIDFVTDIRSDDDGQLVAATYTEHDGRLVSAAVNFIRAHGPALSRALAQLDDGWVRGVNAERREDMSLTGRLRLTAEDDGDMVVTVIDERGSLATVEFCNSGGKSPKTLDALRRLSVAMTEDAAARPLPSPPAQGDANGL